MERVKAERITYARITALSGDYICIYTVDPRTGRYSEYSATHDYETLRLPRTGEDFFTEARAHSADTVCPEDQARFLESFTRENVMSEIHRNGVYTIEYRLMLDGAPRRVSIRAALVEERDGPQVIVGVNTV